MPTLLFCCGAECGTVGVGAGGGTAVDHWSSVGGTAPTISTAIARNGGRAYRFNPAAALSNLRKDAGGPSSCVLRGYVRFATLPSADTRIAGFATTVGTFPGLLYRVATQDIIPQAGGVTTGATPKAVVTGVWYQVDLKCDVSGTTWTCTMSIDGGADTTASSTGEVASTITDVRIGAAVTGSAISADVYWDDFCFSNTLGDYPIGAGQIAGLQPSADGAHSYNAAGDFQFDGTTNIGLSATNTWASLDHLLDTITTFLGVVAAAAGEFLEWLMGDLPSVASINGVEVVSAHHSATTSANKQTLRIVDGATVADVFTDGDFSQTTLVYNSKHYPTAPSGGAWTKAKLDAVKFRWGSSWTVVDISPVPYLDALMVEVDFVPAAGGTDVLFGELHRVDRGVVAQTAAGMGGVLQS